MMLDPTKLKYSEVFSMANLKEIFGAVFDYWGVKILIAAVFSVNDWFFHPHHELTEIVGMFILFDTLTGFLKARKMHNVSSSGFFRFSLKIMVYFILMATASLLDKVGPVTDYFSCLSVMTAFLAVTEAISILENVSALGYSVPTKIISVLKLTKSTMEEPVIPKTKKEDIK